MMESFSEDVPPIIQLLPPTLSLEDRLVELFQKIPSEPLPWMSIFPPANEPIAIHHYLFDAIRYHQGGQRKLFFIQHEQTLVGSVVLKRNSAFSGSAEIGYWLVKESRGKGIMLQACRQLLDAAFRTWRIHRITLKTLVQNEDSQVLANRLGFQKEGRLREAFQLGEQYLDLDQYSLLAQEWEQ